MISWRFKKQATVSRSSDEVEYRALAELTWLIQLLLDFQVLLSPPALLFCDNQAAIHIAINPIFHERTKHIELYCHSIRDKIITGHIELLPIRSQHQLANVFTKALPGSQLFSLLSKMAIINLHGLSEGE